MIERMENRDYVDKEHIIELEGHNAKIFFLKHRKFLNRGSTPTSRKLSLPERPNLQQCLAVTFTVLIAARNYVPTAL